MDYSDTVVVKKETAITSVIIILDKEQAEYLMLLFYKHLPYGTDNQLLGDTYAKLREPNISPASKLTRTRGF